MLIAFRNLLLSPLLALTDETQVRALPAAGKEKCVRGGQGSVKRHSQVRGPELH